MLNKLRGCASFVFIQGRQKTSRTFARSITLPKESIPSKELLWNKNVSIDDKIKFYNILKTNSSDDVAEIIEACSLTANCCFMTKKEKEFKECLVDLKSYCSKLNDQTENKLNENLWNFIIQHFCKEESFHSYAIYLFTRIMKEKKLSKPNLFTLTGILKVCAKGHANINFCEEIVNELERANAMNVFLYSHFINNCISNNNLEKALEIILDMREKGIEPNYAIYIPILKSATLKKNTQVGMRVCKLLKHSNLSSPQLSMTIISFGLKVKQPELVIEQIEIVKQHKWMTSITWNCLIQAHVQMNKIKTAIGCIREMKSNNISPDSGTFTILLTACANSNLFEEGKLIHELATKTLKNDSVEVATSVVNFYTKCGHPEIAIEECEKMKSKGMMNVVSWNCLIQAYIQNGEVPKAIQIINEMKKNNVTPSSSTFTILISACADTKLFEEGKLIHKLARGTLHNESVEVLTAIANFYTKCGHPEIAIEECEKMKSKGMMNVVSFTCLIQAYIHNGKVQQAIKTLLEMNRHKITPNSTTFSILLSACANSNLFEEGKLIHELATKTLKNNSVEVATSVVNFYTKCGHPEIAIEECEKMKSKGMMDIVSWNCLIQAYIQNGEVPKAIQIINEMKHNNVNPSSTTYAILLTVCANSNLYEEGKFIHNLVPANYQDSVELSTAIATFYTKCGHPKIAIEECEKMKSKGLMNNVSVWNCLIQAHIQNNDVQQAIQVMHQMKHSNVNPDSVTFIILISACADLQMFEEGKYIHQLSNVAVNSPTTEMNNSLIYFYTKCGYPEIAIEIFEKMKSKGMANVVSWTCLIQAHIQMNEIQKAIQVVSEMIKYGLQPNSTTFTILLTACTNLNLYEEGRLIHEQAQNLEDLSFQLLTSIVNFYTKCGHPEIAIEECEKMKSKGLMNNVSVWNCLIQAHIQNNDVQKAIQVVSEMKEYDIPADSTTFTILLTACANLNLYEEGRLIHEQAQNLEDLSFQLLTSIVNFYTKCGHPEIAIEECEKMKSKGLMNNVSVWNCLIQAHIQNNDVQQAIQVMHQMKHSNVNPDATAFIILLTACANLNLYEEGRLIHEQAQNLEDLSIQLLTSIVNFYTKCGHPEIAIEECEKMKSKGLMNNVSIWNCLIQAHIQMNEIQKAIRVVSEMIKYGLQPNSTTFTILLTACANLNLYEEGRLIHEQAQNLEDLSIQLLTSIVNFYTKCGHPEIAIEECEKMKSKGLMNNVSIWNCLIQAHIQLTSSIQTPYTTEFGLMNAMTVYEEMKKNNISPDKITYVLLLSVCGEYVARKIGMKIIDEIKLEGMDTHEEIVSVMIYYYSRIANHSMAQELFNNLSKKSNEPTLSIITYNNMLSCYAQHGRGAQAMKLFNEMVAKKVELNEQTFTIMLNTFSHCGMVKEAIELYDEIKKKYKHNPSIIIDCVMVDVFSRAGRFNEAETIINERMDFKLWSALMAGCRKFNNVELAERVFKVLTSVDEKQATPYILLSNIYTYHGLNEKAEHIRQLMVDREIKKIPGIVYQEEDGQLYQFVSGSKDYDRYEEVERMREEIYRKIIRAGFEPDTKWVTNSKLLTEEEKLDSLCRHAEKTAIAHAFVLNPNRKSIILTKNLRVCNDCHTATEFISKVMNVEIIVRDANRYHHFKDGKCSCDRYW